MPTPNADALSREIKQSIKPIYLIWGTEVVLVEERLEQLRAALVAAGFTARESYAVQAGFDWQQLFHSSQSLSLFADKRRIELRLPTGKPDIGQSTKGSEALVEYAAAPSSETLVLVIVCCEVPKPGEKLPSLPQNSKWFKAIEQVGRVLHCPNIPAPRFPAWIAARLRAKHLDAEDEVAARIGYYVEGNLMAAAQTINLLELLYPNEKITAEKLENTLVEHARFNNFAFADACLSGSAARALRVLASLRREQTPPVLVLGVLAYNIRILCRLSALTQQGGDPASLFARFKIWHSRAKAFQDTLKRLDTPQLHALLAQLAHADLLVKGQATIELSGKKDIWEEFESIALSLCGVKLP